MSKMSEHTTLTYSDVAQLVREGFASVSAQLDEQERALAQARADRAAALREARQESMPKNG